MTTRLSPVAVPEWTARHVRGGLDPLGMQAGSIGLYQTLLPGISNITNRMRYYGLYVWLAVHYAHHDRRASRKAWQGTIRRAEALYALAGTVENVEGGMAGNRWASRMINSETAPRIDFGAAAEVGADAPYLRQAWGAYGAAYGSQLFETGLFDRSDDHGIPLASASSGQALADAFGAAIGEAGEIFAATLKTGTATRETLEVLAPMLPGAIPPESRERDAYETLLFRTDPARSDSLRLILRIAEEEGGIPDVVTVRWVLHSGRADWSDLAETRARWFVYLADDLAHVALEGLLKLALDTVGAVTRGMTTARLVAACTDAVAEALAPMPQTWRALLAETTLSDDPGDLDDPLSEAALAERVLAAGRDGGRMATGETGAAALRLLATLHRRIAAEGVDAASILYNSARSVITELAFLDAHKDMPLHDLLDRLVAERVVGRHMQVALGKLRYGGDHTFLFDSDEGRLSLRALDGPTFTNPRLGPAIQFLEDIHLLGEGGLTERGRTLV